MSKEIKYNNCRVCGAKNYNIFSGQLLNLEDVNYFECTVCRYVQTEEPYWLEEAYKMSITATDTGIMIRNQYNARIVLATLYMLGDLDATVVDYAGGYGILVRLLRDYGVNAFWSDRYTKCLLASGFEYEGQTTTLVTAFEALEHFVNPNVEIEEILKISSNVLMSTLIMPTPTPRLEDWWYYGREHGQHIGFYRIETLKYLAEKNGKWLITDGKSYHLFLDKKISAFKWKILKILFNFIPIIFTYKMKSKVWIDHVKIKSVINKDK